MRALCLLFVVVVTAVAQERAELTRPVTVDATIRRYEIVGVIVNVVPTITRPSPMGTATTPPTMYQWNLTIRYVDNVGNELVDVHTDGSDAPRLIHDLVTAPSSSTLNARLLGHLISEKKIGPARVVIGGGK